MVPSSARSSAAVDVVLALARDEVVGKQRGHGLRGGEHRQLCSMRKRETPELDQVAAVAGLRQLRDAADAADLIERRPFGGAAMGGVGLDHADQPVTSRSESSIIAR
jgi:hypothetical protein